MAIHYVDSFQDPLYLWSSPVATKLVDTKSHVHCNISVLNLFEFLLSPLVIKFMQVTLSTFQLVPDWFYNMATKFGNYFFTNQSANGDF